MDNKQSHQQSEHRKYFGEKLLALPGIGDTVDLVREHAWVCTVDEAINKGVEGELGDEVRQIIKKPTVEALQKFLSHEIVEMYMNDSVDEWLELLAVEAGPKIAELWNMSEAAGQRLSRIIYWGERSLTSIEANISPVVLLLEGEKQLQLVKDHRQELQDKGVITISANQVQKGHVYLDVTELPYGSFRSAYKVIGLIRRYLGIKKKDLQAGAPSRIDTQKALEAIYLKNIHKSSKSIAKQLGFRIYSSDNPSGSYPLLHKYLKLGKELEERLVELDKFLSGIPAKIDMGK